MSIWLQAVACIWCSGAGRRFEIQDGFLAETLCQAEKHLGDREPRSDHDGLF
jgi:hypothetical protein